MRNLATFLSLAFLVFLFSGCDDNPLNSNDLGDYLPMKVGNKWWYKGTPVDSTFRDTLSITGTANLGGHKYFVFRHTRNPVPSRSTVQFLRTTANHKIYINYKGKDFLFVDFNQPVGKSWKSYGDYSGIIIKKDFDVTTPAGQFSHAVQVNIFTQIVRDDPEPYLTFVPNVGIVEFGGYFIQPAKLEDYLGKQRAFEN